MRLYLIYMFEMTNSSFKAFFTCEKFLVKISHRMFRAMSEGVFDTNKKTNYIACLKTARRIY
jgi:hypothetical protein